MTFVLQNPGSKDLLVEIDAAAKNAASGGGVFAFASNKGIEAFFALPNIIRHLEQGKSFRLVIGMDAITNSEALFALQEKLGRYARSLSVQAFCHSRQNAIFHPKFCWFERNDGLVLITGSGNLTTGGLGQDAPPFSNWEAFSNQLCSGDEGARIRQDIEGWLTQQAECLHGLDDDDVRNRAIENSRRRFVASAGVRPVAATARKLSPAHGTEATTSEAEFVPMVLISELSSNRPGQADIGKNALKEFFGFSSEQKSALVQHVTLEDVLGRPEEKYLFVNQSGNYRLELGEIAGCDQRASDDSRTILIATKFDRHTFRYAVLPVNARGYRKVLKLLGPINPGGRKMRKKTIPVEKLQKAWQEVPSNLLPVNSTVPEP